MEEKFQFIESLEDQLINHRRDFHKYAESGWTEFRTTSKIAERLQGLGYKVYLGLDVVEPSSVMGRRDDRYIEAQIQRAMRQGASKEIIQRMQGYTGVVALLDTGVEGPTVAFRFDIDSNDVVESTEKGHRPNQEGFASVNYGMMHACGHDGHMAIGLGLAETIAKFKGELKGKIKLIFQPAEEGVRGAKPIVDRGVLDDVDYFLSGHLGFQLENGTIAVKTKGFLSTTKIDVRYTGKGAHAGAEPNKGNNALLAAATAALNIHAIAPHEEGVTRVNVGVLNAGVGRNVVAPNAIMKIETRGENSKLNEYIYEKTIRILESTANMYDVQVNMKKVGQAITVEANEDFIHIIEEEIKDMEEIKELLPEKVLGGSEDASFMMDRVQKNGGKSAYLMFGTKIAAGHHNERFDFDESVLIIAVKVYTKVLFKLNSL